MWPGPTARPAAKDASVSRLNLRLSLSHAAGHFFSLDSVAPRTFLGLTRNPGKVTREYVVVAVIIVLILISPRLVDLFKEMETEKAQATPADEELEIKGAMFILQVSDQQASRDFHAL